MSPRFRRWLKVIWLIVLVLALLTLAVGCGDSAPENGLVVDKRYTPDHYVQESYNQCYAYNKDGICTLSIPVYSNRYVPPRYELKLQRCQANESGEQKCSEGWRNVSEVVYDTYDIGDYFPREGKR